MKTGLGLYRRGKTALSFIRAIGKPKFFCIGLNKTGTTSLQKEMLLQGFTVGNQRQAELLFDDWVKRDFKRIVRYCHTAEFFQDAPFSYPYTFIAVDQAFPGSKFILTVRDNAERWYDSLTRFHGKKWGNGNVPPTTEDLKNATYIDKGRPYRTRFLVHDVPENDPYKKDVHIDYYETHNKNVRDYFRHRPDDLLVINLKNTEDYGQFCRFIGRTQERDGFPWENKTN
jgi:hypothetical protein